MKFRTLNQTSKLLAEFDRLSLKHHGIAANAKLAAEICDAICRAIRKELATYCEGDNPLTDKQVKALQDLLARMEAL